MSYTAVHAEASGTSIEAPSDIMSILLLKIYCIKVPEALHILLNVRSYSLAVE